MHSGVGRAAQHHACYVYNRLENSIAGDFLQYCTLRVAPAMFFICSSSSFVKIVLADSIYTGIAQYGERHLVFIVFSIHESCIYSGFRVSFLLSLVQLGYWMICASTPGRRRVYVHIWSFGDGWDEYPGG